MNVRITRQMVRRAVKNSVPALCGKGEKDYCSTCIVSDAVIDKLGLHDAMPALRVGTDTEGCCVITRSYDGKTHYATNGLYGGPERQLVSIFDKGGKNKNADKIYAQYKAAGILNIEVQPLPEGWLPKVEKRWKCLDNTASPRMFSTTSGAARMEYYSGRWNIGKYRNSKLFVFATKEAALAFKGYDSGIYECLAINPQPCKVRMHSQAGDSLMEKFWESYNTNPTKLDPKSNQYYLSNMYEIFNVHQDGWEVCDALKLL